MKQILFAAAALALGGGISAAAIRNVTARQRRPQNGRRRFEEN